MANPGYLTGLLVLACACVPRVCHACVSVLHLPAHTTTVTQTHRLRALVKQGYSYRHASLATLK
jgi:hypothetical protein